MVSGISAWVAREVATARVGSSVLASARYLDHPIAIGWS
jgi:hypothetical protein